VTFVAEHLILDVSTENMGLICEMSSLEDETAAKCVVGRFKTASSAVMLLYCVLGEGGGAGSYLDRNSQCS